MATHSSILANNPMDRRAWQAIVHGVSKTQMWLSMHICSLKENKSQGSLKNMALGHSHVQSEYFFIVQISIWNLHFGIKKKHPHTLILKDAMGWWCSHFYKLKQWNCGSLCKGSQNIEINTTLCSLNCITIKYWLLHLCLLTQFWHLQLSFNLVPYLW